MATQVELHTSHGLMLIELDDVKAPLSTANFLASARKGFYDGPSFTA